MTDPGFELERMTDQLAYGINQILEGGCDVNTTTRPETVDEHGTKHRHGCTVPEPEILPTRMSGWAFHRCPECGAARLARTGRQEG